MSTGSLQLGYLPLNFSHLYRCHRAATGAAIEHAILIHYQCHLLNEATPELMYVVVNPTPPRINLSKINFKLSPKWEKHFLREKKE